MGDFNNWGSGVIVPNSSVKFATKWKKVQKTIVAADIDNSGTEETIAIALPANGTEAVDIKMVVINYNEGKTKEQEYEVSSQYPKPEGKDSAISVIRSAAGDFDHDGYEDIAFVVDRSLFICTNIRKWDNMTEYSKYISIESFNDSSLIATVSSSSNNIPTLDIASGDVNNDGDKELLVTVGSSKGTTTPKLLIYHGADAKKPYQQIELKVDNNRVYKNPSVCTGKIFDTSDEGIVIGGHVSKEDNGNNASITWLKYDKDKKTYGNVSIINTYWTKLPTRSDYLPDINCVNLNPGTPCYIFIGKCK